MSLATSTLLPPTSCRVEQTIPGALLLTEPTCVTHPAGGLIYVSGGDLQHRNGTDVYYKFRPSSDFAYLTGVTEPGFACLLDPETQVSDSSAW
jgi:hypothetical protein